MYICPTCNKEFEKEEHIQKHFLNCWREHNLNHISKPAPRSENIVTVEIDSDVFDFFQKGLYDRRTFN